MRAPWTHGVTLNHLRALDFWERVDRRGPDDCWRMKTQNHDRYPTVWISGKITGLGVIVCLNAHRVAYALHHGELVPDHLTIDHTCVYPPCVNPLHMDVVTQRENLRRRSLPRPVGPLGRV